MEQWQEKKNQLESDLQNVKRMVENSLDDCEARYTAQFQSLLNQKKVDYKDLSTRCNALSRAKIEQEKDN